MERFSDFAGEAKVEIARKVSTVGIECEPETLLGGVRAVGGEFEDGGGLVDLVEHCDLQESGSGNFGVVGLAPEELTSRRAIWLAGTPGLGPGMSCVSFQRSAVDCAS